MNKLFDIERINKQLEEVKKANIRYIMGVDPYGENNTSGYCLMQISDNPDKFPPKVIISKKGKTDEEFKQEYENLAKYFNAKIIK